MSSISCVAGAEQGQVSDEPEKARESEIKERHRGEMSDEGTIAINGAG